MNPFSLNLLRQLRFADFLDIAVIAVFLYFGLTWMRQRATRPVALGVALLGLLYLIAHRLEMYLTTWVFQTGLTAIIVSVVLMFQEDLRRFFERLNPLAQNKKKQTMLTASVSLEAILESVRVMARDRIGALIVFKGKESLDRHVNGGHTLSGRISTPLILSIFNIATPGHDGAMIIEGDRLERFGVHLPLSTNLREVGVGGTRHTAGLGISEKCDACVVIVSEERGTITVAEGGALEIIHDVDLLRQRITRFYQKRFPNLNAPVRQSWVTRRIGLKIAAGVLSCALWFLFAWRVEMVNRTLTVPIEYRNIPSNWIIADPKPGEARVSLSGPERSFSFDPTILAVSLDMSSIREGSQEIPLTERNVNVPSNITLGTIAPRTIRIKALQMVEEPLQVKPRFVGTLPNSLKILKVDISPAVVYVRVPKNDQTKEYAVHTESINLGDITESQSVRASIVLPETALLSDKSSSTVRVMITLDHR